MQRREFIAYSGNSAVASVAWPCTTSAEITSKVYRLGTLGSRDPYDEKSRFGSILIGVLSRGGYTIGKNLALDARGAGE